MPKGTSSHRLASRNFRSSPYPLNHGKDEESVCNSSETEDTPLKNDWEDAVCPICMHSPHNAVLLLCSSHKKGCRSYMCDTSYRHSNCLDQFQKAYEASSSDHSVGISTSTSSQPATLSRSEGDSLERDGMDTETGRYFHTRAMVSSGENGNIVEGILSDSGLSSNRSFDKHGIPALVCPLCRGNVEGFTVVESARKYLNAKTRSCAQESCSFVGTYDELRKHARHEHPHARPSEVDPDQQRKWRRMEQQRELGDVLSTIRSEIPGGMVFGDYVVEDDNNENEGDDMGMDLPGDESNWLTVFFLFQVFEPTSALRSGRNSSPRRRGLARFFQRVGPDSATRQRRLWGENFEGNGGAETNISSSSDAGENGGNLATRRRRSWRR
ncbi:uncharacterized protein LOC131038344 [Cryptomeria japonica]|uniref:uncharacterized protein LOC131038344 n=1 Tax=Cryptomeria japonica TaxID=3369 RepID=UPI0025AD04CF|nr:uncharacterized protein LOC131038344 [Cryptomeria japonica]XP_057826725.1 uncharacterized protein LOC131038344 [Cryptomeria japonica]